MLTSRRTLSWVLAVVSGGLSASMGMAKGLKELSEARPAGASESTAADAASDSKTANEALEPQAQGVAAEPQSEASPKAQASLEKSAISQALAGRLSVGTSYGWVTGSRTPGKWSPKGGMSDISVGYSIRTIAKAYDAIGTYRYAPMSVHGVQDSQSYRGIWEAHYFGLKVARPVMKVLAYGSLELGYVTAHVLPTDGLPEKTSAEKAGVSIVLGGGADYKVTDQILIGPRLNLGFGTIQTVQLAGAASFLF